MILNLTYISRNLYLFNQVRSRPMYLFSNLDITILHIKGFYYLVNILTSTNYGI